MRRTGRPLGGAANNGRIYDPFSGRFLLLRASASQGQVSPDPFVQSPGDLQNYNRYGYVLNNPLSYTDPSGYFFSKLFRSVARFVKQYWTTIVTVALYAVGAYALALAFQSIMAYQQNGWKGVFVTVATAVVTYGIGQGLGEVQSLASLEGFFHEMARGISHGVVQGFGAEMTGGDFMSGFSAGFMGSVGGSVMGQSSFSKTFSNQSTRVVAAAVVGGTFSVVGGGKFANGAISAAMVQALNHNSHDASEEKRALVSSEDHTLTVWDEWHESVSEGGPIARHRATLEVDVTVSTYSDGFREISVTDVRLAYNWKDDSVGIIAWSRTDIVHVANFRIFHEIKGWRSAQVFNAGKFSRVHVVYDVVQTSSMSFFPQRFGDLLTVRHQRNERVWGVRGSIDIGFNGE